MEKFIEIHDNLIPNYLQNKIEHIACSSMPWYYLKNIAEKHSSLYAPGFGHEFITADILNSPAKSDFLYLLNNVLYIFAYQRNIIINNILMGRLFMHLPTTTPSRDEIHTDVGIPHLVCLYYVTDSDGDTVLFEDDRKTIIKSVTPKKGRIVFFDGSIPHCSTKPSKSTRIIVNFDFFGDFFNKEKEN